MGTLRALVASGIAALVSATVGACADSDTARIQPHIVLITADTLRADHLSVNGYPRATSPNLDAFAARSTHFTDAVTVIPETGPSFATLFTGRTPEEHGMGSNFEGIPAGMPMLAERLAAEGYRTAAFVENPVLRASRGFPRGFQHYELTGPPDENFMRWAAEPWTEPTFVWLHFMDPHGPYTPPAELEALFADDAWAGSDERARICGDSTDSSEAHTKSLGLIPVYQRQGDDCRVASYVARYDAEIRSMDAAFGEVVRSLEQRGLFEDSAVLFASDHGESLGEHGFYFEHGWFAYETALHVPLTIKEPGQREGRVDDRLVSLLDLAPTILALAGAAGDEALVGGDLLGADFSPEPLVVQSSDRYPDKTYGVRDAGWKYLVHPADGREELYDLQLDPREQHCLAARLPDELARMRTLLEDGLRRSRAAARVDGLTPTGGAVDPPELLDQLRALGYVK